MLTTLSPGAMRRLTLGIRDHASLLSGDPDLCRKVLERDRHVCHVCGTRTREGMEIDHVAGHVPCRADKLKAICQFCHNLRHPLWAAARGRILPVFAPDVSQIDLHRLSWAMVAWRSRDAFSASCEAVRKSLQQRHERFAEIVGCTSAEALFEGILTDVRLLGEERSAPAILEMDRFTRFIPLEVMVPAGELAGPGPHQRSARLSTWTIGGFRKVADAVAEDLRRDFEAGAPAGCEGGQG